MELSIQRFDAATQCEQLRQALVGPCSLIKYLHKVRSVAGSMRIFNYSCVLNSTRLFLGDDIPGATGAAGLTEASAMLAAIGEAAERYCAAYIPWQILVKGSARQLGAEAIGIDQFGLYLPEQYQENFPCMPYSADTQLYWVKGRSLLNQQSRLIPAPLIYIPYHYQDKTAKTDFVSLAVSSGTACHSDRQQLRLNGIYEVIERDAFMITWMRKIQQSRLRWMDDATMWALYQQHYAGSGVQFHLFDITLDLQIPTVLCLAESVLRPGRVVVAGCATRASYREAATKAMLEAAQCMTWAQYLVVQHQDWEPAVDYANVQTFQHHVMTYLRPQMLHELDFLLKTPYEKAWPQESQTDLNHCYQQVLALLASQQIDVIEVELTTPEIADVGLSVAKLVLPGLVQINGDHRYPPLANPRFDSVPAKLGLAERCQAYRNPAPHPFP